MPRDRAWRPRVVLAAACALAVPAGIGAFTFVYVDPSAPTRVRLTRPLLVRLIGGQAGLRELVFSDDLQVEGSRLELLSFLMLLERPAGPFPIVTP